MPNPFGFLRRLPDILPRPTADMLISDRNGITGQPLSQMPNDQGGLAVDQSQVPNAGDPGIDPSGMPTPLFRRGPQMAQSLPPSTMDRSPLPPRPVIGQPQQPQAPQPSPYAKPGPYQTKLSPQEEQQFQQWVQSSGVPFDPSPTSDYDMRGYYRDLQQGGQGTQVSQFDGMAHYPDTYKTPYHRTFSNESKYATKDAPHWEGNTLVDKSGNVIADETPQQNQPAAPPQSPQQSAGLPPQVSPQSLQGGRLPFPQYSGTPQGQPPAVTPDTLIGAAYQNLQAQPPPPPSLGRQIAATALGALVPHGAAFAPLVAYGPKGLQQRSEYERQRENVQPLSNLAGVSERLEATRATAADRQIRQRELDEAARSRISTQQLTEQDNFVNRDLGQFVPQGSQIPQGYMQVPSAAYDTPGMMRLSPTPEQKAKLKQQEKATGWVGTVTPQMETTLGPEIGIKAGEQYPQAVFEKFTEMAAKKIKDPNLHFVVGDNDVTGDQTITAINPITGKIESTIVVPGSAKKRPPGAGQDHGQNFIDPTTNKLVRVEPGQTAPAGALTATGLNAINTPTSQSRAMAEMAKTVVQQVPGLLSQVDALKDKVGPGAGRWNQLWVNKAGFNDPDFAGLDQDLDLFASALVRTHFGARGGQGYRDALKKDFSEAQSPEDLKSRIQHADTWLEGYANMNKGTGGGTAAPGGGLATPKTKADYDKLPSGTRYVDPASGRAATKP